MIKPYYESTNGTLYNGSVIDVLSQLPDQSVNCCVTSPPYWGLRDYGVAGQLGLESTPEEYVKNMVAVFREVKRVLKDDGTVWLNLGDTYAFSGRGGNPEESPHRKQATNKGSLIKGGRVLSLKPKDLVGIPWRVAFALQQPYYTGRIKDEKDRIWLASMIDGEGCLFIHKRKAGQNNGQGYSRKNDTYSAGLEVANTHISIIQRCMDITGIGSICTVERETRLKKRNIPLHRWNVRSNQCREIIKEIYPYLVGKQHEARILLGCPSSGTDAEKAHASLMALHNGKDACIDFKPPESMYEPGWYLRQDIIWKKPNPMPESVTDRCTKSHEYIFLLSKSQKYFYDADAIKEKQAASSKERARYGWNGRTEDNSNGARTGSSFKKMAGNNNLMAIMCPEKRNRRSVWSVSTKSFKDAHFAVFPPKLIEPCILAGCPKGGVVLDPFFGSGTTGLVAYEHDRKFIGVDINPEYCAMSAKRLERETQQLRLF